MWKLYICLNNNVETDYLVMILIYKIYFSEKKCQI